MINAFNGSGTGIVMNKGALTFEGGEVSTNKGPGMVLASAPKHAVSAAIIQNNAGPGIQVNAPAGLLLRGSTLVGNTIGVTVTLGSTLNVDLGGDPLGPGNNVFARSGTKNAHAAVCLVNSLPTLAGSPPMPPRLLARSNTWSACPPTQAPLEALTCDTVHDYKDIYFHGLAGAPFPVDGSCP